MKTLITWIGTQDLKGFSQKIKTGPVISALNYYKFKNLILLANNLDTDEIIFRG